MEFYQLVYAKENIEVYKFSWVECKPTCSEEIWGKLENTAVHCKSKTLNCIKGFVQ